MLPTSLNWRHSPRDCAYINVTAKGPTQNAALENAIIEANQLKMRAKTPSPLSRLAIVLFSTGVALLVVAIFAR